MSNNILFEYTMWIIGLMNLKEKKNATKDLFHEVNFSIDYFNHNFFKKLTDLRNNCRVLLYRYFFFLSSCAIRKQEQTSPKY